VLPSCLVPPSDYESVAYSAGAVLLIPPPWYPSRNPDKTNISRPGLMCKGLPLYILDTSLFYLAIVSVVPFSRVVLI
jgi:hypothetical protein